MTVNQIQSKPGLNANGYYVPNGCSLVMSVRAFPFGGVDYTIFMKVLVIDKEGNYQLLQNQLLIPVAQQDGAEIFLVQYLMEGFIQSVHLYMDRATTCHRGDVYASAFIIPSVTLDTGTPILATLCADYIENLKPVSYPESGVKTSLEGQGSIHPFDGTFGNGASGNFTGMGDTRLIFTFLVPSHRRIVPQSLRFKYVASAGTPDFMLVISQQSGDVNITYISGSMINTPGTSFFSFDNNQGNASQLVFAGATLIQGQFPVFPALGAGSQVQVYNNDAGAGTTSLGSFVYEAWIDPQTVNNINNPGQAKPTTPPGPG